MPSRAASEVYDYIKSRDPTLPILRLEELRAMVGSYAESLVARSSEYIRMVTGVGPVFVGGILTTVKIEYGYRRGWGIWMSVREFIQNALDAAGVRGSRIYRSGEKLFIADAGPGLMPREAIFFGASDKPCWSRGFFGEGMKVALFTLEYIGKRVVIFTKMADLYWPLAYTIEAMPDGSVVFLVFAMESLGRLSSVPETSYSSWTVVVVEGVYTEMVDELSDLGLLDPRLAVFNLDVVAELGGKMLVDYWSSEKCSEGGSKPSYVVYDGPEELMGLLWVRDIFVGSVENAARAPSAFSYNLWWIRLRPDRMSVDLESFDGRAEFYDSIHRMVRLVARQAPESLHKILLTPKITRSSVGGYDAYIVNSGYPTSLEYEILRSKDDYEVIAKAYASLLRSRGLQPASIGSESSLERLPRLMHLAGVSPIVIVTGESHEVISYLIEEMGVPSLDDIVNEQLRRIGEARSQNIEVSNEVVKNFIELLRDYAVYICTPVGVEPPKKVAAITGRSFYTMPSEEIYIDVSKLLEVLEACNKRGDVTPTQWSELSFRILTSFYHEIAHHIAYRKALQATGDTKRAMELSDDLTEGHTQGLEAVAFAVSRHGSISEAVAAYMAGTIRITNRTKMVHVTSCALPHVSVSIHRGYLQATDKHEIVRVMAFAGLAYIAWEKMLTLTSVGPEEAAERALPVIRDFASEKLRVSVYDYYIDKMYHAAAAMGPCRYYLAKKDAEWCRRYFARLKEISGDDWGRIVSGLRVFCDSYDGMFAMFGGFMPKIRVYYEVDKTLPYMYLLAKEVIEW